MTFIRYTLALMRHLFLNKTCSLYEHVDFLVGDCTVFVIISKEPPEILFLQIAKKH